VVMRLSCLIDINLVFFSYEDDQLRFLGTELLRYSFGSMVPGMDQRYESFFSQCVFHVFFTRFRGFSCIAVVPVFRSHTIGYLGLYYAIDFLMEQTGNTNEFFLRFQQDLPKTVTILGILIEDFQDHLFGLVVTKHVGKELHYLFIPSQ
jgi:hypothetical protein